MNKIYKKLIGVLVLLVAFTYSCDKSESVLVGEEGGLIEILNPSVNYIVGNPGPYTMSFRVYQGTVKTTQFDIMKTFYTVVNDTAVVDADTVVSQRVVSSNTVTFLTITIDDQTKESVKSVDFTFSELRADLEIDYGLGAGVQALPASDGEFQIGDYWEFEIMPSTDDGRQVVENKTTKVTLATRYAGTYLITGGVYWHPSYYPNPYVTDQWVGGEVIIESIDAITYSWSDWGPLSGWDSQTLYFQVDGDGNITYPETWNGVAQTLNDQPLYTCDRNFADVPHLPCDTYNVVINDDVDGKDVLKMAYAYFTAGSGPREFYFVMEKIVE